MLECAETAAPSVTAVEQSTRRRIPPPDEAGPCFFPSDLFCVPPFGIFAFFITDGMCAFPSS